MTLNAPIPTSTHSQKCGGMARRATRPYTSARRRSARAWLSEGSPRSRIIRPASALLAEATDHEAHVRVARERSRLEHALDDQRFDLAIDLQHHHAAELLTGVQLLPELALVLEHVEELVDALQAVGFHDGARVTRRRAVDQDLRAGDGDHRRVGHVEHVLSVRQLDVLVDRQLTAGREAGEQEQHDAQQEVDERNQRNLLIHRALAATGYL